MVIQVDHITKMFGVNEILNNCVFTIKDKSCVGLIGKNGAGKSTILKIITGIISQTSGSIVYNGRTTLDQSLKKEIGFYLDKDFLPDEMTGHQFLEFIDILYHDGSTSKKNITSLVNYFFENSGDLSEFIKNYSFGMKQKIGICGALLIKPDLLVLDEPFAGLDSFASKNLLKLLQKYKEFHSVIISSHDLHYVEKICDDLIVLDEGLIIFNDSVGKFTTNGLHTIEESLFNTLTVQPEEKLPLLNWLFN